jgi:hypothetical protein
VRQLRNSGADDGPGNGGSDHGPDDGPGNGGSDHGPDGCRNRVRGTHGGGHGLRGTCL